jgi:hypothetical protein
VKTTRMEDEHLCEANAQKLLMTFENVKFHDGESIDEFTPELNRLRSM